MPARHRRCKYSLASGPGLTSVAPVPTEPQVPLLSDGQRRIIGATLTLLAFLASVALVIVALIGLGRLAAYFSAVIWPLAAAGVLALILRPAVEIIERRLKMRRIAAVVLLYGTVALATAGLFLLILPPVVEQLLDFIGYLPVFWGNVTAYLDAHSPQWVALSQKYLAHPSIRKLVDGLAAESKNLFSQTLPSLRAAFGGILAVFAFSTHLALVPVYLFFFLLAGARPAADLGRQLPFLKPGVRDDVVFLAGEFIKIIESFFRGQIVIGLCMGVLLAGGFSLIGLKFGLVIGLALGVLNIIPYLGTIIGLAIALPLAFFQPGGGWQLVGLVLLVKAVVQCVESWVLTPKIMGHHTGLHPVAIIVAVFFWGTAFEGILGMLLAIPLTAFFVTAWRLAKRKYFAAG